MRTRTKARRRAIEALFESEQRGVPVSEVFGRNPDVNEYAVELANETQSNLSRIDELVDTYSKDWPISRMPAVDRSIVRVAIAELLFRRNIDTSVIISEALEIAENLSTPESAKFINGLLANIGSVRENLSAL